MTNYHLTINSKTQGKVILIIRYSDFDELCGVEFRQRDVLLGHAALTWIMGSIPTTLKELEIWKHRPRFHFQEIEQDLSFDTFWNLYDYKKGNRKRAEKTWSKLDDATRIVALKKVKEYNFEMTKVTHGKVFPERWLAQERWENDYD